MVTTILRLPSVLRKRGRSRSAHYLDIQQGLFTPPIQIGSRAVGWPSNEVDAINAARISGCSDSEVRVLVCQLKVERKLLLPALHREVVSVTCDDECAVSEEWRGQFEVQAPTIENVHDRNQAEKYKNQNWKSRDSKGPNLACQNQDDQPVQGSRRAAKGVSND